MKEIITIINNINEIKSKNQDLNKLSVKDQKLLLKLEKELDAISVYIDKENKQLRELMLLNNKLEVDKETLIDKNKELSKYINVLKSNKKSYREIITTFLISTITHLFSYTLLKWILKKTVHPYLERMLSYVLMGVIFNNIFGDYLRFIYEILLEFFNYSESLKALFSIFSLSFLTEWYKDIIQYIKSFFEHFNNESIQTPIEEINKENEKILDKQLEIDRLENQNELLRNELEKLYSYLNNKTENQTINIHEKSWSDFFKEVGKDFGITAYNAAKLMIIAGLVKYAGSYIWTHYLKGFLDNKLNFETSKDDLNNELKEIIIQRDNNHLNINYVSSKIFQEGDKSTQLASRLSDLIDERNKILFNIENLEQKYKELFKDNKFSIYDLIQKMKSNDKDIQISDISKENQSIEESSSKGKNKEIDILGNKETVREDVLERIRKIIAKNEAKMQQILDDPYESDNENLTNSNETIKPSISSQSNEHLNKEPQTISLYNNKICQTIESNLIHSKTDQSAQTENSYLNKAIQTITTFLGNSNLSTSVDNDQTYLGLDSQKDQGYVKVDNNQNNSILDSQEYKKFNADCDRIKDLGMRGEFLQNEISKLDTLRDSKLIEAYYRELQVITRESEVLGISINEFRSTLNK